MNRHHLLSLGLWFSYFKKGRGLSKLAQSSPLPVLEIKSLMGSQEGVITSRWSGHSLGALIFVGLTWYWSQWLHVAWLQCHPVKCRAIRDTLTPADHLSPSDDIHIIMLLWCPKSCGFLRTDPVVGCLPGLAQKIFRRIQRAIQTF